MPLDYIKEKISPILKKYRVSYAGVFGSQARGDATANSDVDLLVRFEKVPGLVGFIRLENELKSALQTEVDVVVEGSEKPFIKESMKKDLVTMYGE